jgi:hypothetical protein
MAGIFLFLSPGRFLCFLCFLPGVNLAAVLVVFRVSAVFFLPAGFLTDDLIGFIERGND